MPTATLRPEPIPLELKVILIGPPLLYHLLHAIDEDFPELFKVGRLRSGHGLVG